MARVPDLIRFCRKHDLLMITVAELARYRFDLEYESAVLALDGIFPVCPRVSHDESVKVEPGGAPYLQAEHAA
jgi:hypothetical protein